MIDQQNLIISFPPLTSLMVWNCLAVCLRMTSTGHVDSTAEGSHYRLNNALHPLDKGHPAFGVNYSNKIVTVACAECTTASSRKMMFSVIEAQVTHTRSNS